MDLNEIINKKGQLLIESYFEMQIAAEKLYGQNTVIFIEIGSFYEIYQSDTVGKASDIAQELNIVLTRKNKNIPGVSVKNPALCGIPTVSLDKHLDRLTGENKWTILLVSQVGRPPEITREISKIISPGTNIDYLHDEDYNFIASVFIEKNAEGIVYAGLSMIDLGTGKVISFENYGTKNDKDLAIDEIIDVLKTNTCSEIILTHNGFEDAGALEEKFSLGGSICCTTRESKDVKKGLKIAYQNELLNWTFDLQTFLSPIEEIDMERTPNALNALTLLIDFVADHNMKVVQKLSRPVNVKNSSFLYLGNNALEQLNIIGDNKKETLLNIVNNGCSAIGKRFIADQLKNPLLDTSEIRKRFSLPGQITSSMKDELRSHLRSIYDIERISRKIELQSIAPFELHNLYTSIEDVLLIAEELSEKGLSIEDFGLSSSKVLELEKFRLDIEGLFNLEKLSTFSMNNITSSFVGQGRFENLDLLVIELEDVYEKVNRLSLSVQNLISSKYDKNMDLRGNPRDTKLGEVKVRFNDSEGFFLEVSNMVDIYKMKENKDFQKELSEEIGAFETKALKGSKKYYFTQLEILSNKILALESRIISTNKEVFLEYTQGLDMSIMTAAISFIAYTELIINNVVLSEKFGYNKPEILDIEDSFVEAINLRHAIIEQIQSEIYVPNDIVLGNREHCLEDHGVEEIFQDKDNVTGMLLYGLNSSGKSSAMKSLGIAIVLAQAGFFVPATVFRFRPFENLFTRVTGSDNIYKGLSTFAIEMLELKNIFNRANERTLVLGDEIAHGTETVSALAIVAGAVVRLVEKGALFIFATHLHQLKDIEDVSELESVVNVHLEVIYEENTGELIYNRKIKRGPGSSIYGLEFAKFMQMDKGFLDRAHKIRKDIAGDLDGLAALTRQKKSLYNKDKYVGICEVCSEAQATEVHHLAPQRAANEHGRIEHFSKDHKANLLSVCHDCHMKLESGEISIEEKRMTSSGLKALRQ